MRVYKFHIFFFLEEKQIKFEAQAPKIKVVVEEPAVRKKFKRKRRKKKKKIRLRHESGNPGEKDSGYVKFFIKFS